MAVGVFLLGYDGLNENWGDFLLFGAYMGLYDGKGYAGVVYIFKI